MDTVFKFSRVILTKELNEKFREVGKLFEVAVVLDDAFILRDAGTKVALGVVSFKDFDNHFVVEKNFKGWTPWTGMIGFDGQNDILYRTNRKKVQMKFLTDEVRSEACCHREDEFDIYLGLQIAYLRCCNKVLKKQKDKYEEELRKINIKITDNNRVVEDMIKSLND